MQMSSETKLNFRITLHEYYFNSLQTLNVGNPGKKSFLYLSGIDNLSCVGTEYIVYLPFHVYR